MYAPASLFRRCTVEIEQRNGIDKIKGYNNISGWKHFDKCTWVINLFWSDLVTGISIKVVENSIE